MKTLHSSMRNSVLLHVFLWTFRFTQNVLCDDDDNRTLPVSFLASVSRGQGMGKLYGGAFFRAVSDINADPSLLPRYTLKPIFADTRSDILAAAKSMTDHYCLNGTTAFVGPEGSCAIAATLSAAWNLPMIAYRCHDTSLSKQGEFEDQLRQTFVRTQPSTSKVSKSIISLLQHYKWNIITLIIGTSRKSNQTAESLFHLLKDTSIRVTQTAIFEEPYHRRIFSSSDADMERILENTYTHTRIYVFLGDNHALIDFARALYKHPILPHNEYVIITVDDRQFTTKSESYFLKTPFEDKLESFHVEAFRPVLVISPRSPYSPRWTAFLDDVRRLNTAPPINLPRPPPGTNITQQVPIYAAYLYDAITVYAKAVTHLLNEGKSYHNGSAVVEWIQNRTHMSIQGFEVYIDPQGDAEGNYSLLALRRPEYTAPSLDAVGGFKLKASGLGIPEFGLQQDIDWPLGHPPRDQPACGFEGEKCQYKPDWKLATFCSVIGAALAILSVFAGRHYLYEKKLAKLLWKIEYKDLVLLDSVEEIVPHRKPKMLLFRALRGSTLSRRGGDTLQKTSSMDLQFPTLFPKYYNYIVEKARSELLKRKSNTSWRFLIDGDEPERATLLGNTRHDKKQSIWEQARVGSYKGNIVSIKCMVKKHIVINRSLKKKLQVRKELTHDNVNRFIGACINDPYLYIVTQYCARGSLEDILKNEDLNLDDMFIASLIADLIKGMIFIHESEIGYHGNLKSRNCLVDSRWVLQVSDFGLQQLVCKDSNNKSNIEKNYRSMLWKAPELLRSRNVHVHGTQRGDVYSFGIILYEILGREGPWGDIEYSPKEIVQRVSCCVGDYPFRPDLSKIECEDYLKQCMDHCWLEVPEQRPDFKYIRYRLKPLQQGLKSNIFDNMLAIMEKYANNLEALVDERTEELSDEKKMTENLLYRMLPRPVANRLKRGLFVEPETYECVSLYFSDIVGFTSLSAESTPRQVIDMLNELYTCFDSIIGNFDVYKVETIGDAYLVVSGLPIRNGDNHAGEIASMSLRLLAAIKSFKIKHRPDYTLRLRIGVHSGSCVAGVVGLRMPRYTLFGDSVNTASRMETNGIPLKIHCSSEFKEILDKLGGYTLSERGYVTMKGKGEQFTYFLEMEDESFRLRRLAEWKRMLSGHSSFTSPNSCNHFESEAYPDNCDNFRRPNGWARCNGVGLELSASILEEPERLELPNSFTDETLSTLSSHSDYKQNLEHSAEYQTVQSALCKMCDLVPLMSTRRENLAFIGSDTTEDEAV